MIRPMTSLQNRLKYLLILDFEATCGDTIPAGQHEIIEFPTLLYDVRRKEVKFTFHEYVRPVQHPILTDFCTELTGITQDVVNKADAFPDVWLRFQQFLEEHGVKNDPSSHAFLTCGDWDLKTMLPEQLAYASGTDPKIPAASGAPLDRWINVKKAFRKHYSIPRNMGMDGMLRWLDMTLEGRHHSGIDDCKNIARIVQRMQADGWNVDAAFA